MGRQRLAVVLASLALGPSLGAASARTESGSERVEAEAREKQRGAECSTLPLNWRFNPNRPSRAGCYG